MITFYSKQKKNDTSLIFSKSSPICLNLDAVYVNTFCSSIFLSSISAKITWNAMAIPVCYKYFLNIYACFFFFRVSLSTTWLIQICTSQGYYCCYYFSGCGGGVGYFFYYFGGQGFFSYYFFNYYFFGYYFLPGQGFFGYYFLPAYCFLGYYFFVYYFLGYYFFGASCFFGYYFFGYYFAGGGALGGMILLSLQTLEQVVNLLQTSSINYYFEFLIQIFISLTLIHLISLSAQNYNFPYFHTFYIYQMISVQFPLHYYIDSTQIR